jgi:hypothetical protein
MAHACLLNLYIKETEMDRDQMFVALSHMESLNVSSTGACEAYAQTVAEIAEKVSMDEMRRLLLIGAYLFNLSADKGEAIDRLWQTERMRIQ